MSNCKFCGKEIMWMKEGRKNMAINSDGTTHKCDEMKNARSSLKKISPTDIDPDVIAEYEKQMNLQKKKKKPTF